MGVFEMIAIVTALGCGTGLVMRAIEAWAQVEKAKYLGRGDAANAELRAIREELQALRQQNADVMLGFDTAIHRLGAMSAPPAQVCQPTVTAGQRRD